MMAISTAQQPKNISESELDPIQAVTPGWFAPLPLTQATMGSLAVFSQAIDLNALMDVALVREE